MENFMVDVLIIGSGGAGLSAALAAKEAGASVMVAGKMYPTNSQTAMAQGGINAALGNIEEDHIASHIADTVKSAHGLCDEQMVRKMCADAPLTIDWLNTLGVPFSRIDNGKTGKETVAQHQMGGASAKRACYAQDYTGLKILHTLYDQCLKAKIAFLDEHYLLNIITEEGVSKGATFLDIRTGEVVQIDAKSLVIATGGYASLYHGFTTNAYGATGDGVAAVLRAGGAVSDMEFIQFHPTALKHSAILISESARGEGGYLLNCDGERFVDELKPRDEVARAIFAQLQHGKEVFLDLRHLGEEKLMEILPQEVALCRLHEQVDPARELIPIKPVAHYSMGGIDVDDALEVNGIKGCFAVGECSKA
jgi:succinate dehydrogenase / fumarate reductase flavoprotein subunit